MKTRLVLAGFALLMLVVFLLGLHLIHIYGHSESQAGFLGFVVSFLLILPPLPFFSALVMLAFSLFKVETLPDGSLTYDPTNPYWRLMQRYWKEKWSANISVCKACFLTSIFLGWCLFILAMTFMIGFMVWLFLQGEFSGGNFNWGEMVPGLIFMAGFIIPALVGRKLFDFGQERQIKVLKVLGQWIIRVWTVSWFVILPICVFMNKEHLDLFSAILVYLKWAGIFVSALLLVWTALCLVFYIGEKTILGQWLKAWKNDFCPILNPVKAEEKS